MTPEYREPVESNEPLEAERFGPDAGANKPMETTQEIEITDGQADPDCDATDDATAEEKEAAEADRFGEIEGNEHNNLV